MASISPFTLSCADAEVAQWRRLVVTKRLGERNSDFEYRLPVVTDSNGSGEDDTGRLFEARESGYRRLTPTRDEESLPPYRPDRMALPRRRR